MARRLVVRQFLFARRGVKKKAALAASKGIAARAAMLSDDHVAPLERWRETNVDRPMPHFDPADGGVEARMLLLLETPGPGSEPLQFVSRDNSTGTGANLRRFLDEAAIAREDTVIWNAVPWIVHEPGARNRAVLAGEVREGVALLPPVLALLPLLRVAVLAGRIAERAVPMIARERPDLSIIIVPHPSPTIMCTSPAFPERMQAGLAQAATILAQP